MPSTSWPAPGGIDVNLVSGIFYYLQGLNIVGCDFCELNGLMQPVHAPAHVAATTLVNMAHLIAIGRGLAEPVFEYDFG
jgi:arginase family enzyme